MLYVEFIERDRHVPIEVFRTLGVQTVWQDPDDELLGQIGRTLRLGPHPAYIAFCRFNNFRRLDQWEAHFHSEEHARDKRMHAKHQAIHHFRAGCYDELISARQRLAGGLYYVEFFSSSSPADDANLEAYFVNRQNRLAGAELSMVLRRIGMLAPDPGGMAIWTVDNYVAVEAIARNVGGPDGAQPSAAGVYRDFAEEIL
jgi:hypothetical protein